MSVTDDKIGRLIKAAGKGKSQLAGDYTPTVTDDTEKVAIEGGMKEDSAPMKNFSSDKVIEAVNSAKTLDEKLKAYVSASGVTTMDQNASSTAPKNDPSS